MKKHYLFITVIFAIAITMYGISVNNVRAVSEIKGTTETEESCYILRDYNGRIALFEPDNEKPVKVFDVFTRSLPENDVMLLRKGIRINARDVEKKLEEYLS